MTTISRQWRIAGGSVVLVMCLLFLLPQVWPQNCTSDRVISSVARPPAPCPSPSPSAKNPDPVIIWVDPPQPPPWPDVPPEPPPDPLKNLNERGPQFQPVYSMSAFAVQGFVRGNWPMLLDYELEPASFALLTVVAERVEPFYYRLDGTKIGRHLDIIRLPERFGGRVQVGLFFVRAMKDHLGEVEPAHLHVYGIGAGDRAVGSVAIDQLSFTPATIRSGQAKATYSFHARNDFPKTEAEFHRVGLYKGQIVATRVGSHRIGAVRRGASKSSEWDGKNEKGKPSPGQHIFQVRAWWKADDGGDWVAAWSEDLVAVN